MAGRGDPPDGTPEGAAGGDDEYRSVVFDESFVRAARLQELSAHERLTDREHAVRVRPGHPGPVPHAFRNGPRQLLALFVLIALAFGTAVYLGFRQPYRVPGASAPAVPLRMTVVPLVPAGTVEGGTPAALLAHSPAARFRSGGVGIRLPAPARTDDFSRGQVGAALNLVKAYLVASSLDRDVLAGRDRDAVRRLLAPAQTAQFDRSFTAPAADGLHDPAGWLVSFDAARVRQATADVRVRGSLAFQETADQALEVTSDHTFVYTLRPAGPAADDAASLFTVRRELRFRFDREQLARGQVQLVESEVGAGPEACGTGAGRTFAPLLAGAGPPAGGPRGVDPFATGHLAGALCGVLATAAP
ncbi:hypothetical protein [Streptomyces tremellae]|uniref:Uncharacterized protein n=1 Tax=Streptomyces tremellae TaxID=1124239 RepID=A0ABP7G3Q2_9ACTN